MFHPLTRSTLVAVAAVLAIGAISLPAAARTTVAFAGRANDPADAGCFSEWYGTMTNVCGATKVLVIPITVDPAGNYTVTVTGYGASASNNVGCQALGIDKDTTSVWGSSMNYLPSFGAPTDIAPLYSYVPGSGSLFAACWVNPGGRVNVINTTW
jgi:hypothetical protein